MLKPAAVIGIVVAALLLATPTAVAANPVWSLSSSPNIGTNHNELNGVSCVSATSCMAVGEYVRGSEWRTLIESWNGSTWSLSSSPNPGTGDYLYGVSCVSATSCKAVGFYSNGSRTLIESWNGHTWSLSSSPNLGTIYNRLNGVSCVSATSCKAVGIYSNGSASRTFIESWNGHTWSLSSSPNLGSGTDNNQLFGVSCVSATSCKAVGEYVKVDVWQTLIESWNGTTWSVSSSPNKPGNGDHLNGVSCVSATSCQAVGFYANDSDYDRTLVESWNGSRWSLTPSPSITSVIPVTPPKPGQPTTVPSNDFLYEVSCVSATSCEAVGQYSGGDQALIEFWNGSTWSVSPSPTGTNDQLNGVSCLSASPCEAVGTYTDVGGFGRTLIESSG